MSEKISRPPSVLITQVILVVLGSLWGFAAGLNLFFAFSLIGNLTQFVFAVIPGIIFFIFSAVFLVGFWGIMKRRNYGRLIGVIVLSVMSVIIFLGNIFRPKGPMEYYEYKNAAELAGAILAGIIFYGLMSLLIYRLGFGKKARTFFSSRELPAPVPEPPPPPVFNG